MKDAKTDTHSAARPDEIAVSHVKLDLTVDFDQQRIDGIAELRLQRNRDADRVWLDTRGLDIGQVELLDVWEESTDSATPGSATAGREAEFVWHEAQVYLGRPLEIPILPDTQAVRIRYHTTAESVALQWLAADQTLGKRQPFLFTQSQAVLARTWFPCQDTPSVRTTYNAIVRVPRELMAVMSAANPTKKSDDGIFRFAMNQPIPSYLFALAVGDLEFQALGTRTGVYAEPAIVESAAYEFAETEKMIAAAEQLYGPYRWERYDLLVLPPSFPFGGMENPRLTFVTPTVLAGDRSLVSLIAHELAHSWSGNLVTNASWEDFWLNEGFTVYFEHRIMESVYGRDYDQILALLGLQGLKHELRELPERDTWLKLDLTGRDPDDAMTDIAYEKGYLFLRTVEEAVGRERFDAFLREYFDQHAFGSMTTEKFMALLREKLLNDDDQLIARLKLGQWVYGPGLPDNCPEITSAALAAVEQQARQFAEAAEVAAIETKDWTTHHFLQFLRALPKPLPADQMTRLDARFRFSSSRNSEIVFEWLLHVVSTMYEPAMPQLKTFLTSQGRRKFLRPLYEELIKTPEGRARANQIYAAARPTYHAISVETIDKVLDWTP